ncbi:MAG: beta-N-acetylhexosaminidase, partial [Candidatus Ruthia sp.]|nr:beta-N-acetylhexosaminidase [Candidatus Ruthturnera sp.]
MELGPIMMDVSGLTLTSDEKQQLNKPSIGGVILFTRNYQDIEQIKALIQSIRLINQELLIAVDHEGGRVQRFRQGFTRLPAMEKLGEVYDKNPEQALEQA